MKRYSQEVLRNASRDLMASVISRASFESKLSIAIHYLDLISMTDNEPMSKELADIAISIINVMEN